MVSTFVNHVSSIAVRFRDFAGSGGNEAAGNMDWMAGAEHCAERLFACRTIRLLLNQKTRD